MTNYPIQTVNWAEIVELSNKIAIEIGNQNIDTLIPILRGGMPLSLLLASRLENVETSCIHIKRSVHNRPNSDFSSPLFEGITNHQKITGKNVLICEDIIDKGDSLDLALKIINQYRPASITIATLFNFNKDKYKDVISGQKMSEYYWIEFPWEQVND